MREKKSTSYADLLKDPRWQKKRLNILERDSWECRSCGDNTRTLHVHHRRYERGKMPWEADERYLETLCEACHEAHTALRRQFMSLLDDLEFQRFERLIGFVQGMMIETGERDVGQARSGEQLMGAWQALSYPPNELDLVEWFRKAVEGPSK